jgi:hypothetical protein
MMTGKRVLSGCVGIGMLASLVHDIIVGEFSVHGEPIRRTAHPFGFWLYGTFIAVLGLALLYGAAFGYLEREKH